MAKALKVIGKVAGVVALVASVIAPPIGAIATVVAAAANVGSSLLQKAPPARGSVSQVLIQADAPTPYVMGEGYFAGVMRHDVAYGATLNKVPNPYRLMATVYSGAGPIESITPWVDKAPVSSWYSTFLYTTTQLGTQPTATAMAPFFSGAPGWTSNSKLSGQAAILWNLKFDKDGKRFASGIPQLGAYGKWVKVYDPRKDSTFPGGSGSHRLGVESTYEWSENPALHAGTYCYGRYQNGKRVMGMGLPADGINWANVAAWANVCDANEWTMFGVVYEPGDRWANLKDICAAGGAEPVLTTPMSFKYSAPKVALDTITEADLADGPASVTAMQSWRDLINTIVPKYRSPDHEWELVPADNEVSVSSYVTEDGEVKRQEWPFNFVKDVDQASQLAAYRLVDARELQPIQLSCHPRLRAYRPGECLSLDIPSLGLNTDAIILKRTFNPETMTVDLILMGETPDKHDFALGLTGTAPPTPFIGQDAEERDTVRDEVMQFYPVAGLDAQDIADTIAVGGGLAATTVGTSALIPDSVTSSTSAYTISATAIGTSFTNVQSAGASPVGGSVVRVSFSGNVINNSPTNVATVELQILRGSTVIYGPVIINLQPIANQVVSVDFSDAPPSGAVTYSAEMSRSSVTPCDCSFRSLATLETKR